MKQIRLIRVAIAVPVSADVDNVLNLFTEAANAGTITEWALIPDAKGDRSPKVIDSASVVDLFESALVV